MTDATAERSDSHKATSPVFEFAGAVDEEYDYIIVGSGAGGGPVAANLAKAGFKVLVLEAGGADEPIEYKVPAFHAFSTEHNDLAWKFYVQHYADPARAKRDTRNYLDNEVVDGVPRNGIFYPRAGTLGGCTAHHAMILIYPHNSDWEHLAVVTGDRSWGADRMRRYFERLERCNYVKRPWSDLVNFSRHGFEGWLPTSFPDPTLLIRDTNLARVVIAAAQTCLRLNARGLRGFLQRTLDWFDPRGWSDVGLFERSWDWVESNFDPNDWRQVKQGAEGMTLTPLTTRQGARVGTRELVCETMQAQPDRLTVKLHALVSRVILDETQRATGVEFFDAAHIYRADPNSPASDAATLTPRTVRARREVILAGGTFNTPQLLMLSGIGPPDELAKHGIDIKVPLSGVGKNLQDRYEVGIVHRMDRNFEILRDASFDVGDPNFREWRSGFGLYTTNGAVIAIIKRSSHAQPDPDLYLFAIPNHFSGYRPGYSGHARTDQNYLTWVILKAHTKNTAGRVSLRTKDPRDPPDVNFHYFEEGSDANGDDLDGVVAGVELVRKIMRRMAGISVEEIPGPAASSRSDIAQFVRDSAWGHHACGTCKIGADGDDLAVLDSRFRVRGAKGLRVVDASVFPKIPGFFILSAVYMIAEKASDDIVADARH